MQQLEPVFHIIAEYVVDEVYAPGTLNKSKMMRCKSSANALHEVSTYKRIGLSTWWANGSVVTLVSFCCIGGNAEGGYGIYGTYEEYVPHENPGMLQLDHEATRRQRDQLIAMWRAM